MLNGSGTVLDYHASDAYGLQYSTGGSTDPYLGFGAQWGYYRDGETSMYLLGHRYYDLNHGRFLNQDPIGFEGGINRYGYGGNNPANMIDPLGLNGADGEEARQEWRAAHSPNGRPIEFVPPDFGGPVKPFDPAPLASVYPEIRALLAPPCPRSPESPAAPIQSATEMPAGGVPPSPSSDAQELGGPGEFARDLGRDAVVEGVTGQADMEGLGAVVGGELSLADGTVVLGSAIATLKPEIERNRMALQQSIDGDDADGKVTPQQQDFMDNVGPKP